MSNTVFQELGREVLSMAGGLVSSLKAQASAEKEKRVNVTADNKLKTPSLVVFHGFFFSFFVLYVCAWAGVFRYLGKRTNTKGDGS
ncbi:uncharacterized protein CLUP02_14774 [Colletotrichum lupini]|uniref:Uncharacterized protein n=1 Tax=Colletotrichum lupini TaxID=145971 RepID=A0A9Q8T5L2_9PEZI|nr:uncharacterized protein CLUP02_14774 [Colletotrichum lupini]UQC89245.1 hypothetical protein CLUP02_14774 [Colletotrichum lupini]